MKVLFKKNIKSYSGENDELVYQAFREGRVCIGRDYVYPTITTNNHHIGSEMKNLALVYGNASVSYKADLKKYAQRNGQENVSRYALIPSGYALFIRMMHAWQKTDPTHIDLTTVTITDILTLDGDVISIARAVGAGFLAHISVFDDLTAVIGVQMNPVIASLAKELATQMKHLVNIPFVNEEEEEVFFRLLVTKVLELSFGHLLKLVDPPKPAST